MYILHIAPCLKHPYPLLVALQSLRHLRLRHCIHMCFYDSRWLVNVLTHFEQRISQRALRSWVEPRPRFVRCDNAQDGGYCADSLHRRLARGGGTARAWTKHTVR